MAVPVNEAAAAAAEEAATAGAPESNNAAEMLPWCYPLFVVGAFASSVVWMHLIAGELVALMEAAGIALGKARPALRSGHVRSQNKRMVACAAANVDHALCARVKMRVPPWVCVG